MHLMDSCRSANFWVTVWGTTFYIEFRRIACKLRAVLFYCRIAEESPIGLPLQVYYSDISSALEISSLYQRPSRKWENAKNWLCINAGIRLVRILTSKDDEYRNCICVTREDDSEETLNLAIAAAFAQLGVTVDVDLERDADHIMS